MFPFSRKEKEYNENKALEEILHDFEQEFKDGTNQKTVNGQNIVPDTAPVKHTPLNNKCISVDSLAEFLAGKGLISISEWEAFKNKI